MRRKPRCLVLGQYKKARSVHLLAELARHLRAHELRLVGRDWPPIEGWHLVPHFVAEEEVDREIASADVVLIPYEDFYQSGVLVRAFEQGTPVVTTSHEQTIALYGRDWPGIAPAWTPTAVADAIIRATATRRDEVSQRRRSAWTGAVQLWQEFIAARLG
jgi:hypothetical protein